MKNIVGIILDKYIKTLGYGYDYTGASDEKIALDPTSKAIKVQLANAGIGSTDHGSLSGLGDDDHAQYLRTDGTRALTGNQSFGLNEATNIALENLGALPSAGTTGRVVYLTTDDHLYLDTG